MTATGPGAGRSERRHDLDWVRVLAIFSVLWYHAAQLFTGQLKGLKAGEPSEVLREFCYFFHQWRMPLLFCISGAVCWAALERRGGREFAADRARRLLIPLGVGVVALLPLQLYVGYGAGASYLEFYPRLFDVITADRYARLGHFWFIAYLLLADLVVLPALSPLAGQTVARWRRAASSALNRPVGWAAVAAVVAAVRVLPTSVVGDWTVLGVADFKDFVYYAAFYVIGLLLAGSAGSWARISDRRHHLLAAALAAQVAVYLLRAVVGGGGPTAPTASRLLLAAGGVTAWLWVIVMFGYAKAHLGFENGLLRYAREASYPVYLLHYSVLIAFAVPMAAWDAPVWLRYPLLVALTAGGTVALYHLVVRRFDLTRCAFGLRPRGTPITVGRALDRWRRPRVGTPTYSSATGSRSMVMRKSYDFGIGNRSAK